MEILLKMNKELKIKKKYILIHTYNNFKNVCNFKKIINFKKFKILKKNVCYNNYMIIINLKIFNLIFLIYFKFKIY